MTANRWWVRLFARWQARIDSVKGQIQAVSLAVTAYSTFSLLLQSVGLGRWVPVLGVVLLVVGPAYAYFFFEGGVFNQVSRDRADMSSNFPSPSQYIGNYMTACALMALMDGEELSDEDRQIAKNELDAVFNEVRNGIDLEEIDE
jgi:hypothetical protein